MYKYFPYVLELCTTGVDDLLDLNRNREEGRQGVLEVAHGAQMGHGEAGKMKVVNASSRNFHIIVAREMYSANIYSQFPISITI